MKKAIDYDIIDHGVEHSQYFQGCGTYGTDFDDVFTGIGDDALDAYNDAIQQVYTTNIDSNSLDTLLPEKPKALDYTAEALDNSREDEDCEIWHHVSIRLKLED